MYLVIDVETKDDVVRGLNFSSICPVFISVLEVERRFSESARSLTDYDYRYKFFEWDRNGVESFLKYFTSLPDTDKILIGFNITQFDIPLLIFKTLKEFPELENLIIHFLNRLNRMFIKDILRFFEMLGMKRMSKYECLSHYLGTHVADIIFPEECRGVDKLHDRGLLVRCSKLELLSYWILYFYINGVASTRRLFNEFRRALRETSSEVYSTVSMLVRRLDL